MISAKKGPIVSRKKLALWNKVVHMVWFEINLEKRIFELSTSNLHIKAKVMWVKTNCPIYLWSDNNAI